MTNSFYEIDYTYRIKEGGQVKIEAAAGDTAAAEDVALDYIRDEVLMDQDVSDITIEGIMELKD